MKKCEYCNRESGDDALQCQECGTAFDSKDDACQLAGPWEILQRQTPKRLKWTLCLAAWGVVLIATLVANPVYVLTAPLFPLGLIAVLPHGEEKAIFAFMMGLPAIAIGWAIYATLGMGIASTKRNWAFIVLFTVLCMTLALNVAGCQRTLHAVEEIH